MLRNEASHNNIMESFAIAQDDNFEVPFIQMEMQAESL